MTLPLARLPSLDLLRGFVAAGRRMSITQAAADLFITQSALSKQVRALEQALGVTLFQRGHRSLAFTDEGARLFRQADAALAQLQQGLAALAGSDAPAQQAAVTLTLPVSVAGVWLVPRLGRLRAALPQVDVRVAATVRVLDLAAEGIDLAIRYADASLAEAGWHWLFDERVKPVAVPGLATQPLDAQRLPQCVLLELDEPTRPGLRWGPWLQARGLRLESARSVVRCNHYDQLIQAAVDGQGLALGRIGLLVDHLRDGRLQALPGHAALPNGRAYWLRAAVPQPRPAVAQVHEWLVAEAAAVRQAMQAHDAARPPAAAG